MLSQRKSPWTIALSSSGGMFSGMDIDTVKLGHGGVHRIKIGRTLVARNVGQVSVPEDPHLDQVHDVEGRAHLVAILAASENMGKGEGRLLPRCQYLDLALDRMGALEKQARRLAPQDIGTGRGH